MSEERKKFQGRDVMEAVSAAREHFGVTRKDLGYEVIEMPGVGKVEDPSGALVTIEAWKEENAHPPRVFRDDERGFGRGRDRGGRGHDRSRGRDRDRDRGGRGRDREPRHAHDEAEQSFIMPALLPPAEVSEAREILEHLAKSLLTGLNIGLEIDEIVENEIGLRVRLQGEDIGLLLESGAEGLEALQYLANRILQRDGRVKTRVSFDAGDHRARQEARLIESARCFADEVLATGETRKMPPMGPYERRLVHMTLDELEGIRTYSSGSGFQRRLHIAPEKKAGDVPTTQESADQKPETNVTE